MTPVDYVKARLTNFRTGSFIQLLFNPTTISYDRKVNISDDPLPMMSDPLVRWASGGSTTVSFAVELCGESSLRLRGANLVNALEAEVEEEPTETLGVDGELEWLNSHTYPVDPSLPGARPGPDLLIFSYGRAFRYFAGVLDGLTVTHKYFTADGRTMRASTQIKLRKVETSTTYADRVYSAGYEGYIP